MLATLAVLASLFYTLGVFSLPAASGKLSARKAIEGSARMFIDLSDLSSANADQDFLVCQSKKSRFIQYDRRCVLARPSLDKNTYLPSAHAV